MNLETLIQNAAEWRTRLETGKAARAAVMDEMLVALIDASGPPPEPIPEFSTDMREVVVRAPKGRPLFLARAWTTGRWQCLIFDESPVPMGRPLFLRNKSTGKAHIALDYHSRKFQGRVQAALHAVGLQLPKGCSINQVVRLDRERVFVAYAVVLPTERTEALPGDLDNYAKNIADAAQRAGVIANDRQFARVVVTREPLPRPAKTLHAFLADAVRSLREAEPQLPQRELSKRLGLSQPQVNSLLKQLGLNRRQKHRTTNTKP
jgi:Holliday junction resolvase RusA-like endonuclease